MMIRTLSVPQIKRARSLFITWLADQRSVRLGHATRELERLDRQEPLAEGHQHPSSGQINPRLVSALLRANGFHKTGYTGSGYDREPVYARPMPPMAAIS